MELGAEMRLFQGGESVLDGELDETGEIADTQLMHQASAISLDSLDGEREGVGDLCARFALDDELQDFPFAWAEARQRAVCFGGLALAHVVVDQPIRYFLALVAVTSVNGANGIDYFDASRFFQQVAACPGLQGLKDMFRCGVHREDDNLGGGTNFANFPGCLDAIQLGHGYVHDHNVRTELSHLAHRLAPIGCITNHSDIRLCL